MRFLADESCDFAVVRALEEKGFDALNTVPEFRHRMGQAGREKPPQKFAFNMLRKTEGVYEEVLRVSS